MPRKKMRSKISKLTATPKASADVIKTEVIPETLPVINPPVLLKVCRLCEIKDGPFLNIFDSEKITAKRIEDLMPFVVTENDDLPHKICFRCSAKVEELHEFVQKCIKTQNSLRIALGKKDPIPLKTKTRKMWEEKLNQSNMSNDDICDALIKKAMEGIKDFKHDLEDLEPAKELQKPPEKEETEKNKLPKPIKSTKVVRNKKEESPSYPVRSTRSKNSEPLLEGLKKSMSNKKPDTPPDEPVQPTANKTSEPTATVVTPRIKVSDKLFTQVVSDDEVEDSEIVIPPKIIKTDNNTNIKVNTTINFSLAEPEQKVEKKNDVEEFNIMDHVSMIKVNGVGVLFQCKLCNRNFLKEDVVKTHNCAKNGLKLAGKIDLTTNVPIPAPAKIPLVKYINTKIKDTKPSASLDDNKNVSTPDTKPKPKIGPASKIRRDESNPAIGTVVTPRVPTPPPSQPSLPSVNFPKTPSLNSRYKLIPGPNNSYTLVEESNTNENDDISVGKQYSDNDSKEISELKVSKTKGSKMMAKPSSAKHEIQEQNPPTINVAKEQPYPVGLFQTLPHNSNIFSPPPDPVPFTTPAMKKQSYTIVQTGNPSKLLISTKQQPPETVEPPKKRGRKPKASEKTSLEQKQPFSVTLEDNARPKDAGFFTFINVDPLLQPSYVLPTNTIIQESQISTSSSIGKTKVNPVETKDKYNCNMCDETFTREKKLLAHIQSHYNQMDLEDEMRSEKQTRKRSRK